MSWPGSQPPEQLIYEIAQIRGEEELQKLRTTDSYQRNLDFADSAKPDARRGAVFVLMILLLIALCLGIIWLVA